MSPQNWRWAEQAVDRTGDHFELRFGNLVEPDARRLVALALVGRPTGLVFPVQWLLDPNTSAEEARRMRIEATTELDFYLIEHPQQSSESGKDPWSYAIYHCGTAANIYSLVHWSYFPETAAERRRYPVIQKSAEEPMMRITTGLKLASGLRHGDYVQIEKDDAKVHRVYAAKDGRPRICRPALFVVKGSRSWRASADGLPGELCDACNR